MVASVSGVISPPSSNSDVKDGTAVPAAYGNEHQYTTTPKSDDMSKLSSVANNDCFVSTLTEVTQPF